MDFYFILSNFYIESLYKLHLDCLYEYEMFE